MFTFDMAASSLGPTSLYPSASSSATAARRTAAPTSAVMSLILYQHQEACIRNMMQGP